MHLQKVITDGRIITEEESDDEILVWTIEIVIYRINVSTYELNNFLPYRGY